MKTIRDQVIQPKNGPAYRRVTVEIRVGDKLLAVHPDAYYKLGAPLDEVVKGHVLEDTRQAYWCSASQEWKD